MNRKTMLHVALPATRRTYDIAVPEDMSIHDASYLSAQILAEREPDRYAAQGDITFMDSRTGALINPNATVRQAGLADGSQVTLV
ncbi:hypothetical protein OZX73_02485 [Bifidobacterium sp. ESL0775]|uniref:hypothetical protein n=1 Tax=Bifidobacterium sp. ESL0775 TaxID=2983230 RepID=UPI0023F93641|nr:hypothetical protein [Bifidobacterium sp. ESL0775]WEV69762.1 hypothetical protein OZX73_02485 [Bifidobacterium sp. ESL0775]